MRYAQTLTTKKPRSRLFPKRRKKGEAIVPTSSEWKSWKRMKFCTGKSTPPTLFQLVNSHPNKWRTPEMGRSPRGSFSIWKRSALVLPFMPWRVLTTDSSYSILVLNHDWQPDRRYDVWESWVGKIVDIRGNSPRNVRSFRPCTDTRAYWPSSKDLGNRTMVLLREGHFGTRIREE
jgi:hypothetical protein